jgi:hypothetical protein
LVFALVGKFVVWAPAECEFETWIREHTSAALTKQSLS